MKARFLVEIINPESEAVEETDGAEAEAIEGDIEDLLMEEGYHTSVRLLTKKEQQYLELEI